MSVGTSVLRWAGWATVTYMSGWALKTRVGKRKNFYGASRRILSNICLPTLAWNPAGAPDSMRMTSPRWGGDTPSPYLRGFRPLNPRGLRPLDEDDLLLRLFKALVSGYMCWSHLATVHVNSCIESYRIVSVPHNPTITHASQKVSIHFCRATTLCKAHEVMLS